MNTKQAKKACKLRYFSSLTAKQKDETQKFVCRLLAVKNPDFIDPSLWGVLFDVSFDQIIATKNEADKYLVGQCFRYKTLWLPIAVKNLTVKN
jgi:hypothetical protein